MAEEATAPRAVAGVSVPDPVVAGCVRSVDGAEDDAHAILYFLRRGLTTHDIDLAQPVGLAG